MGKMASLFFNKPGRIAFYLCLTIYLYGDLAIYGAAVAKSMRDVMCTYTPANVSKSNISEYELCWENSPIIRMDAYRIALTGFVCLLGKNKIHLDFLEGKTNKNNCLVSNFYNNLEISALFSQLFRTENSAARRCKFQNVVEIDHKAVVLIFLSL